MGNSQVTSEERAAIGAEFSAPSPSADDCVWCKRQISSSRQISHPGAMLCDSCAKADTDEEER